jgi:hypothetical protein
MSVMARAKGAIDWIAEGYRPRPTPLGVLRILFALHVMIFPVDYTWVARVPAEFFNPPPGPFALLAGPPSAEFLIGLEIVRFAVALWLLLGWRTLYASIAMSLILIVGSGIVHSFSKVDHFILYELTPLALGLAGWGAALSWDSWRRKARTTDGFVVFLWGIIVAFGLFTAALPKVRAGWLDPFKEATRSYVARDQVEGMKTGLFADFLLQIDFDLFWKFLDYATVFAEGWLIVAVFLPGFFRLGLLLLSCFHVGVYLSLGIDFSTYFFVYAAFFCLSLRDWFPELTLIRRRRALRGRSTLSAFNSPKPAS